MRNFALLAASSAGALLMTVVQVDAMTFSNTASARDVLPSADTVTRTSWVVPHAQLPASVLRTTAVLLGFELVPAMALLSVL